MGEKMDEGYVEMVNADRRLVAIRFRDTSSYCVVRLLDDTVPQPGEWAQFDFRDNGDVFLVGRQGETTPVAVLRFHSSRDEAQRQLDASP